MWKLSEQAEGLAHELHTLLLSTSWFGSAKRYARIVSLLDQINEVAALPIVARCLFSSSQAVRNAASRSIHRLLSQVSSEQLIQLSGVIGRSWRWHISDEWDRLSPESVSALAAGYGDRTAVLGLLSFHCKGYVREKVIQLLARDRSGNELPFLLIRQNDWVNVIAQEAQEAVSERLVPSYLAHFVRCLGLVIHSLAFRRRDLSPAVRTVVEMLVQPRHDALLIHAIRASNPPVRRQVVAFALDIPGNHHERVIRHGLLSQDDIVRLVCAKRVTRSLTGLELSQALVTLQQDPFMPVRREGFRGQAESFPGDASSIWRRALLDRHGSIRDLARYWLEKTGRFDAAAFYRQNLADKGVSLAVISGLAECGDDRDIATLRAFLAHSQPSFRRTALRGIGRIARERAVDDLLRSLLDTSQKVVREASTQLESFLNEVPGKALFAILQQCHTDYGIRQVLQMLFAKGKWQSLPWLIRVAFHADQATASLARRFINAWFSPPLCNKVFTKPSAAEWKAIEEAMAEDRDLEGDDFVRRLQFLLRL
jgi:HEAT repeat protein